MTRRAFLSTIGAGAAVVAAVFTTTSYSVSGQSGAAPRLVVTAFNGATPPAYTTARTPWGDPDLQGTWSSDDATFPVARPQNQSELYLSDEQWAARQKQITQGVSNAENAVGSFRGDFARRAFRQTSYIVDPPDGRMPPVKPDAQRRRAPRDQGTFGDGPFDWTTDMTLYDRCITRGIYGSVTRVIYGNGNRIVQAPGMVVISYEMIHDTRVIYTDGRAHLNNGLRQYLGSSRGRWDGDELVIETTNLTDQTSIGANGNGLRHSDQMKMTERLKRVADNVVQYQLTVDDPVTYEKPFTISIPLTPLDGGVLLPYECHEGNHAMENALGAERAEDRALAADHAKGNLRARRRIQGELGVGGQPIGEAGPGGPPAPAPGRAGGPAK